jgi:hypothetical protein
LAIALGEVGGIRSEKSSGSKPDTVTTTVGGPNVMSLGVVVVARICAVGTERPDLGHRGRPPVLLDAPDQPAHPPVAAELLIDLAHDRLSRSSGALPQSRRLPLSLGLLQYLFSLPAGLL